MTKSKNFWLKANNVFKTKDECFSSLKNKFVINIVIKNDFRVNLEYIIDILKETYNFIENIRFSNIADAIIKISHTDPQSLYKGIDSSQLR